MKILYYYRGIPADTALVNMTEMINALREVGQEVIPCFPIRPGNRGAGRGSSRALRLRHRVPRAVWNLGQLWADRRATRSLLSICDSERPTGIGRLGRLHQLAPSLLSSTVVLRCQQG